ncbi:hypothetical protein SAMN00790413_05983 [Deinococcus hopiensis KR-140]|uniref:Uncharacterized protein n=1 Tax=Deinococcus hopiensis KR-140 TaxID=695939 RepID=A0A1W1VW53_9DEIO|nr:hypothetical protein SAMN00790413_05983 [Deinococcus hopiensis KR-140]
MAAQAAAQEEAPGIDTGCNRVDTLRPALNSLWRSFLAGEVGLPPEITLDKILNRVYLMDLREAHSGNVIKVLTRLRQRSTLTESLKEFAPDAQPE